jgi:hypothetical protein
MSIQNAPNPGHHFKANQELFIVIIQNPFDAFDLFVTSFLNSS